MIYPDYESGSILNLVSTILNFYKIPALYPPLHNFILPEHKRLAFIVIDGLGMSFLESHGRDSRLYQHTLGELTSVFPSTTSCALVSLMTGVAPLQHALTGWYMYFRELGTAGLPLPFKARFTDKTFFDMGVDANEIFDFETIFSSLKKEIFVTTPQITINSAFSKFCFENIPQKGFTSLKDSFQIIKQQLISKPQTEKIYAYIPYFDDVAHTYGINSRQSIDLFHQIDDLFFDLFKNIDDPDTLFVITADHGLLDTTKEQILYLKDYPDIKKCLILPLCGEPRVPYCYISPSKLDYFHEAVDEQLGSFCDRYTQKEVLEMQLYGTGKANPRFYDRIGDEILIMKGNYVLLDRVYHEKDVSIVGFHGGMSREEMMVPLVVYHNKIK